MVISLISAVPALAWKGLWIFLYSAKKWKLWTRNVTNVKLLLVYKISRPGKVVLLSYTCYSTPVCRGSTPFYVSGCTSSSLFEKNKAAPPGIQNSFTQHLTEKKKKTVWLKSDPLKDTRVTSHSALHLSSSLLFLIFFLFFDIEQHRPNILQSLWVSVLKLSKSNRVNWKLFPSRLHM